VTLVSRSLYDEAERASIREPEIIFNGASLPGSRPTAAPKTHLLYVGRLDRDKNVSGLLRAYCESGIEVPLIVAGDGSERTVLEGQYKDSPIRFLGNISPKALVELYASAYAFVTASTFETFCLPVIEAASVGCPSVGPNSGALPEVIRDGETGYLINDLGKEFGEILARIVSLGVDDRRELENACRIWAGRFQWATIARHYEDAYARIAASGPPLWSTKAEEPAPAAPLPNSRQKADAQSKS
jgi:glycosyltransferase involved in cell wall biosynthesis